jgi:hypothetical protein
MGRRYAIIILALPLAIGKVYYHVLREAFPLVSFMVVLSIMVWGLKALAFAVLPVIVFLAAENLIDDLDDWDDINNMASIEAWIAVFVWLSWVCFSH